MSDVAQVVKDLSKKFDILQKDVDNNIKKSAKKKKKHSRRSSCLSRKPRSLSRSPSKPPNPSTSRGDPNNSVVEHMVTLPVLGVEHVATHPAMDAPAAPFTVLPCPKWRFSGSTSPERFERWTTGHNPQRLGGHTGISGLRRGNPV